MISMKMTPILCGSAFKNKGVQQLLDGVVDFLPSPLDVESVTGIDPNTGQEVKRRPSDSEPFAALAFKIMTDPFAGQLTFFASVFWDAEDGNVLIECDEGDANQASGQSSDTEKQKRGTLI